MLFGVDWYPEQWDESRWAQDAERMAAFGIRAARIMEFGWSAVEPEEGRYDFSLFERAMEALHRRGISTVLGTPTATLPAWLGEGGERVRQVHRSGTERDFGLRREGCFSSPAYRAAARRLVSEIGRRFGHDERVIGFQVDNEPGHEGSDVCVCPLCAQAWPLWLERSYGTVEALNEAWGTVFWGRSLSRFGQAPLPRRQDALRHNPALVLDYFRFQSDQAASFLGMQTGILREAAPGKWITTNLYPPSVSNAFDFEALGAGMDFLSLDNYPVWGDMEEPYPWAFMASLAALTRGLRPGRPFAVMEQFTGIQGHSFLGHYPPEAQVALWTNQMVAHGADKLFYFRWRTAPFGQEQLCRGLYDNDDAETPWGRALRENLARFKGEFDTFASVPPESRAALVLDKDNARFLRELPLSQGLSWELPQGQQAGTDLELGRQYSPFVLFNVGADVLSPRALLAGGLSKYRLLSLPLYQMADPELVSALESWVAAGGTLVLSWRAGTRDLRAQAPRETAPGPFRKLAGLCVRRWESLNRGKVGLRLKGLPRLVPTRGEIWADILDLEGARPVAWYADGRKHYRGSPAVSVNAFGKGRVWYLGTSPDPLSIFFLWRRILKSAGLRPRFLGMGVELVDRVDASGRPLSIVLNHTPRSCIVRGRRVAPWGTEIIR